MSSYVKQINVQGNLAEINPLSITDTYESSFTYAKGAYVYHDGLLYTCTTAIETAEAWNAEHWERVTIGLDVQDLKDTLSTINKNVFNAMSKTVNQVMTYVPFAYKTFAGKRYLIKNESSTERQVTMLARTRQTRDGENGTHIADGVLPGQTAVYEATEDADYIAVIFGTNTVNPAFTIIQEDGTPAKVEKISEDVENLTEDVDDLKSSLDALNEDVNGDTSTNYTVGKNLTANSVSHTIIDDPNSCLSDYIAKTWETSKIRFIYTDDTTGTTVYQIWYFDSNKNYLGFSGWNGAGSTYRAVIPPEGTAFVRFSFKKGFEGKLTDNGTPPVVIYTATETVISDGLVQKIGDLSELETTEKSDLVGAINEVKNNIPDVDGIIPIAPKDTTFFHISKNMIDPATCVSGEYVNQTTGAFVTNSAHARTDYIEVEPSTAYVVRVNSGAVASNFRYVFYTAEKTYISGSVGALSEMLLTSPANAKYIIVSDSVSMALHMIAPYVNGDKSFEAFGNDYIEPKYIVDGSADDIILNVPSKTYALVGYETNIYFENITEKWNDFTWDVTCEKGMQLERGYRITPTDSDVGTYTLTIRASINEDIYKEVSTTLVVTSASVGSGQTTSVIVLGDSTTNNGIAVTKLNANFDDDVMSVTTLGTRGTAPNNHEGRSGWSWDTYFTKASETYTDGRGTVYNPFYNPSTQTFDANYYFANSGIVKPDVFIINMGINDVFGYSNDVALETGMTTILARTESAVQSILGATTNTKVCICLTIPPNHSQDAFGKAYACGQTRNRCKRNNTLWVNALIEQFKDREDERIYIIPINACLDTVNNMGMETLPVNARNTAVTYQSSIANGGVHPVESGYWQIADAYTAFLKAYAGS